MLFNTEAIIVIHSMAFSGTTEQAKSICCQTRKSKREKQNPLLLRTRPIGLQSKTLAKKSLTGKTPRTRRTRPTYPRAIRRQKEKCIQGQRVPPDHR